MFVIRDKKSKTLLHMSQALPGESRKPEELLPGFDPKTMEFGRSESPSIPAWFTIEEGIVKPMEEPASEVKPRSLPEPPAPSLEESRKTTLEELSRRSFQLRQQLIPDHEMQNAALGIYDEKRTQAIRETIKAFRDEYHRLEATVKKARSVREVQGVKANFPTRLVEATASGPSKKSDTSKEKK